MRTYYEKGSVLRMIINKNDSGYVQVIDDEKISTLLKNIIEGNSVESVNGQTGEVILNSADIDALPNDSIIEQSATRLIAENTSYSNNDPVTFLDDPHKYQIFKFKLEATACQGYACWVDTNDGEQIRGFYTTVTSTPNVFTAYIIINNITKTNNVYTGTLELYYYNKNSNALQTTKLDGLYGITYDIEAPEGGD